jgi:hypothetical protein
MASNGLELPHDVDKFGGVLIKPEGLRSDPVLFANDIRHSLALWSEKKRRGVWLTLPTELCDLVPIAVKVCFRLRARKQECPLSLLNFFVPHMLFLNTWCCEVAIENKS